METDWSGLLHVMLLAVRLKLQSSVVIGQFQSIGKVGRIVRFVGYVNVVNKSFVGYQYLLASVERNLF